MNLRKLHSDISGNRILRKQRSEFVNTRYQTSRQSTSACEKNNMFGDQLSSISLKDCLDQINLHIVEQRPLQPMFAVQIKKFLSQVKKKQRQMTGQQEDKRQSKESTADQRFMIKSPYIGSQSVKKFKIGLIENQTTQVVRRTLKKKRMNFENGEVQISTKAKKSTQKIQIKIVQKTSQIKQLFETINRQMKLFKDHILCQVQQLKTFFICQLHTIGETASKTVKDCIIDVRQLFSKSQTQLLQTVRDLQNRINVGQQRQRILKDYLKNREAQLVTFWTTLSLRPF